jgi:hypothetical protein
MDVCRLVGVLHVFMMIESYKGDPHVSIYHSDIDGYDLLQLHHEKVKHWF